MNKIHVLPAQVVNQIAAGEVVERPASIVKELIENSIDAGAEVIVVEVWQGGKERIKVSDNGCGMEREDARLCFEKHATSKIAVSEDLHRLKTLGFRGEAIASIASVSIVELKTRVRGMDHGTEILIEGGEQRKFQDCGCVEGTQFDIRSLFFNTPARRKFLKGDATEYGHISECVSQFAIRYPGIHFKFFHNGKQVFDLPKAADMRTRIEALLGSDYAKELIPVFCGHKDVEIGGFVGGPDAARSTRAGQYLFINGRSIMNSYIAHAVKSGFGSYLPEKKHPAFVLQIRINPELADFNIHPRKLEVKFVNQQEVYSLVKSAVKKALEGISLMPEFGGGAGGNFAKDAAAAHGQISEDTAAGVRSGELFQHHGKIWSDTKTSRLSGAGREASSGDYFLSKSGREVLEKFSDRSRGGKSPEQSFAIPDSPLYAPEFFGYDRVEDRPAAALKPRAQIARSYLVCESEDGIVLIDQHAAHERIMFMKLKENAARSEKRKQALLIPLQITLSHRETEALSANKDMLENLGFELEFFGGNAFSLLAVPAFLNQDDAVFIIKGVVDDLLEDKPVRGVEGKEDVILSYVACRSAIKFGKELSLGEQEALLKQLAESEMKYTCPHGRPTMIRLSFGELEKRFGRRD